MARFVANRREMDHMLKSPNGMVGSYLKQRGAALRVLASRQVGTKTYRLKRSITSILKTNSSGELMVQVGSDSPIAFIHHNGTKPHTIKPRFKRALRFQQHGKIVFASVVKHPGTKPNKYLTDNLPKVID